MLADVTAPRTRADLEARLASAGPELAAILRAALDAGEGSEAWHLAELELGVS